MIRMRHELTHERVYLYIYIYMCLKGVHIRFLDECGMGCALFSAFHIFEPFIYIIIILLSCVYDRFLISDWSAPSFLFCIALFESFAWLDSVAGSDAHFHSHSSRPGRIERGLWGHRMYEYTQTDACLTHTIDSLCI